MPPELLSGTGDLNVQRLNPQPRQVRESTWARTCLPWSLRWWSSVCGSRPKRRREDRLPEFSPSECIHSHRDGSPEPGISSSRIRLGLIAVLGGWLCALVNVLVGLGLAWSWKHRVARSAPISLPSEDRAWGTCRGAGFPVAQACPDRAAPTGSRWSAPLDESQCPVKGGV